ncbi:MAG: IPTL-CTERM sorting domain-containing protein [Burkholderiales bacterium]|nr:IPTL-CTERM sorting domain-containing protein [Burkholderiales bacterium]
MKPRHLRAVFTRAVYAAVAAAGIATVATPATAARIGILSNRFATETAADFNSRIPAHSFTAINTAASIPTLQTLTDAYDVILVFEDQTYGNSTAVGNTAAAFATSGRAVVIGAFYDQDRSDGPAANAPHGWGALETLDPNTTDGAGTPYAPRTLDTSTMVRHALTGGVTALYSAKFAGGNAAKPGTNVVAWWRQANARGQPDPAIAFRITGAACVVQVAMAPNYPATGVVGTDYSGDFHRVWQNAFDFGANKCVSTTRDSETPGAEAIPTLSQWGLVLTMLLVGAVGALQRRRRVR